MKISFCTTCLGRGHHLEKTLYKNVADNPTEKGMDVEFVVLAYGRHALDDLQWMRQGKIRQYVEEGTIKFAHYADAEFFNVRHAKNLAHRLATGDVLCNLDADNYLGKGFALYLADMFSSNPAIIANPFLHHTGNKEKRGYFGRIAIKRENFMRLGGYDEEKLKDYSPEDMDLIYRATRAGFELRIIDCPNYLHVIEHSNLERVRNMFDESRWEREVRKINECDHGKYALFHKLLLHFGFYTRPVQANKGSGFGVGEVAVGFGNDRQAVEKLAQENLHAGFKGLVEVIRSLLKRRVPQIVSKIGMMQKSVSSYLILQL